MNMRTAFRFAVGGVILSLGLVGGARAETEVAPEKALTKPGAFSETAPESYKVKFETTSGAFTLEVTRAWAPNGADRFYNLVKSGFYDETRFFRVVPGFVVQWGISGDPEIAEPWSEASIEDDPVKESNKAGSVSYAMRGPGTRTTQVFINLKDNSSSLDGRGFAPFGRVTEGMEIIEQLYSGYGDGPPRGNGPYQPRFQEEGNAYLEEFFPKLDHIKKATLIP
jgi:peptidyl-prolyl cis-trans isomerase A (cyclophilin A)